MQQRPTVKRDFSLSNPAVRAWLYQLLVIVIVVAVAGYLLHNTVTNLAQRGITSGFAFLNNSAVWHCSASYRLPAGRYLCPRISGRAAQHAAGFSALYCFRFGAGLYARTGAALG